MPNLVVSAPALIPPFRFSTVQHELYRGSYPTLKNFRFLKRLALKTIVSVIPEPPTSDLMEFCAQEKIVNYHFYAEKFTQDNVTVSPATVGQILQLMIKQENLPLYIHCLDGANVTGIIIMVLRKLQNWTKVATVSEFCRFTRDHGIEKDESEYLAAFSEEIVVTADAPKWLWNGVRVTKHPTMIVHQPDLELAVGTGSDALGSSTRLQNNRHAFYWFSASATKWETEVEKTEAILRQFEEASRTRTQQLTDAAERIEEIDLTTDDALMDIPIPRSLEALDLAGVTNGSFISSVSWQQEASTSTKLMEELTTNIAVEDKDGKNNSEEYADDNAADTSSSATTTTTQSQSHLQSDLFVFTNQKAGMKDVDKARVKKIVYEMSKNSLFFQNSLRQNEKVEKRIREMRIQLQSLSQAKREILSRQIDQRMIQLEASRDLTRTIVVVDMDMFYAAVEMRDNPRFREVPLAVGGLSMISTTNYIARKFGVRAAMPGFIGKELCPELVFTPVDMPKYSAIAKQIRAIFAVYDPNFTAFSLDEACLDITEYMAANWMKYISDEDMEHRTGMLERSGGDDEEELKDTEASHSYPSEMHPCFSPEQRVAIASAVIAELRHNIFEKTQLTASAGIATNTMLAKICSDMNKPNGQYVLPFTRESVVSFTHNLSVRKISGIGKVMEKILGALGIQTGKDLYDKRVEIFHVFSEKTASWLLRISLAVQAEDHEQSERKSYSRERTFSSLSDPQLLEKKCLEICERLAADLQKGGSGAKTLTLKLKCSDFSVRTRSVSYTCALSTKDDLYNNAVEILRKELPLKLRLMGVRASALVSLTQANRRGASNTQDHPAKRQLAIEKFTSSAICTDTLDYFDFQVSNKSRTKKESPMKKFLIRARNETDNDSTQSHVTEESNEDEQSRKTAIPSSFHPCPICGKLINTNNNIALNAHVDKCINGEAQQSRQTAPTANTKKRRKTLTSYFTTTTQ